ncbi:MAG: Holliday junction branch migration protein RuvA [Oligosphaeraceae bacterium]|mgnify:CR=1 FL=1|nr:Holliday junction branch migration protein RuvA [Oligosphaeraceae bacterium]
MIARITGVLVENSLTEAFIEVQGICYALLVPLSTVDRLPPLQQKVSLHTHLHVREDILQLYGFYSKEELDLFRILLNAVPGIGPKLAMNVLSSMSIKHFCQAIAERDLKALSKISGVGKKTAERMVVELRDKLEALAPATALAAGMPTLSDQAADAVAALETLGYKKDVASKAVLKVCEEAKPDNLSASELIRKTLAKLNA